MFLFFSFLRRIVALRNEENCKTGAFYHRLQLAERL